MDSQASHGVYCTGFQKARPPSGQEESSDGGLEDRQETQIDDDILNDKEKDALRTLALSEDCTDPLDETGVVPAPVEESSGDGPNWNDSQCSRNMRRAIELCSPGSLRHQKITSMLQTCMCEREERFAREEKLHQFRRDSLIARGVPREHADLLLRNSSDPLPTQLKDDLDALHQKDIEEEKEARKQKV